MSGYSTSENNIDQPLNKRGSLNLSQFTSLMQKKAEELRGSENKENFKKQIFRIRAFSSNGKGISYRSLGHRKVVCKSLDEKVTGLDKVISLVSLSQDRRTDIVAYRGAVCNLKASPRKMACKNQSIFHLKSSQTTLTTIIIRI